MAARMRLHLVDVQRERWLSDTVARWPRTRQPNPRFCFAGQADSNRWVAKPRRI